MDWDTPAKLPKLSKNRVLPHGINPAFLAPGSQRAMSGFNNMLPKQLQAQGLSMKGNLPPLLQAAPKNKPIPGLIRTNNPRGMQNPVFNQHSMQKGEDKKNCVWDSLLKCIFFLLYRNDDARRPGAVASNE
jgi:hypothetical protein